MAKGKKQHKHCQKYLLQRRRINNKERKLEKKIKILEEARKQEIINSNTKLPTKRRPIENIIRSCRIGRAKEGFTKESFKCKSQKRIVE